MFLVGSLASRPADAQAITSLEFSFSNPGARSLGFGGAFVALADDATAAFANPAGLVQIAEPELSVEARSWSYSTPYTRGGRAAGEPTGWGIDTTAGPLRGESSAHLAGLSYVSFVYPSKRWSLALFQHQLANFEFGLETQGLFGPGGVVSGTVRGEIQRSQIDLEIVTHGVAVAFRPIDRLSFGLGLSFFDPFIRFNGWDYLPDTDTVESYFSEASFLPQRLVQSVNLETTDTDLGLSAGLLWRMSDRWSLGGVYREAPEPVFTIGLEAGPAHPLFPPGFEFVKGFDTQWELPDVYALGLGFRSSDGRWTGALEWKRVEYSSIIESLLPQQRDADDFLDDTDELRLGGEYAFFAGTSVLAIRAGVWRDPNHYFGTRSNEPFIRAILVPGEDELHWAAGFGAALRRVQIDFGVDLSQRIDTFSLSIIYSFGR
jgi:long-subunit fatty acid transport protein